jgi:hypothetical protein
MREACRALRGSILRQEIYALDGRDESDRAYSASERNYTIDVKGTARNGRVSQLFCVLAVQS